MELSKNNIFVRYYNWIYNKYPNDICSFFWGSLFIILTAPFISLGTFIDRKSDPKSYKYDYPEYIAVRIFYGMIIPLFLYILIETGNGILELFKYEFTHWLSIVFGGLFLGILAFSTVIGIFYGLYVLISLSLIYRRDRMHKVVFEKKQKGPTFMDNFKSFVAAIRGKYCSKIIIKH
jgi:hypothetical protein